MTGPLAYRGWHTASIDQPLPMPEVQKRLASRKCNRCETTYSRYWRSDLEEPNKWLCNNCGMNQRRGRLNQRQMYSIEKLIPTVPSLIILKLQEAIASIIMERLIHLMILTQDIMQDIMQYD